MEVTQTNGSSTPKKSPWGWIIGGLFLVAGIGGIFSNFISGFCTLIAGLIIFPPSYEFLSSKFKFQLSKGIKIVIVLVLLGVIGAATEGSSKTTPSASSTPSPSLSPTPVIITTTTPKPTFGLGITRTQVINGVHKADSSINFQPSTPVNGIERYMAINGQNGIELYGPADNLTEVTSTALLGNNQSDFSGNMNALVYVIGVGSVVDTAGNSWIATAMKQVTDGWNNGQDSVQESAVVNGKKFLLSGQQSDAFRFVSLTIYSAQDSSEPTKAD